MDWLNKRIERNAPSVAGALAYGGAYLNPQLFRGEAAHQITIAEQELRGFLAGSGLPTGTAQS